MSETPLLTDVLRHPLVLRILSFAILIGLWEYGGRVPISPAFPTFLETMRALFGMLADGSLIRAFAVTLQPLVIGLVVSIVVGVGIGVAMGLDELLEWLSAPLLVAVCPM